MGKYSLVVKNTLDDSIYYIKTLNLDTMHWETGVHIKDIDYWTSQFPDKFSFLESLYQQGIINFQFGNTYTVTTYGGKEYYFKNIYNDKKLNDIAASVVDGKIQEKELTKETVKGFFSLVTRENFMDKLNQTLYINKTMKSMIINYLEALKEADEKPEKIEECQDLYLRIKEEFMRYKTFRGLVLFINEYELEYEITKRKNVVSKKQNISVTTNVKSRKTFEDSMQKATERHNRECDEFLSEEEYEAAYQGKEENWHPHRR